MPQLTIAENQNISYEIIQGDTDKPYLVFLHEGLGCTAMWKEFPGKLCEITNCPGLLYDRLGYGKSSPLDQRPRTIHYLHKYGLQELPTFLEKIIPAKSYILIGHSDGGSISLIYGAERPSPLKGIITEAAHVFVDPQTVAGVARADTLWHKGKLSGLNKYHGEKTETLFMAWAITWQSEWFKSWNIEYLLPSIKVPLLAIQGKNDQYGSLNQVTTIVNGSGGHATAKIIKNCGHIPHLEAQPAVLTLMSNFITYI